MSPLRRFGIREWVLLGAGLLVVVLALWLAGERNVAALVVAIAGAAAYLAVRRRPRP